MTESVYAVANISVIASKGQVENTCIFVLLILIEGSSEPFCMHAFFFLRRGAIMNQTYIRISC